jgi:hypothetical protein
MTEEATERTENEWEGSPLQMWRGLDPNGITEIVLQFDTGDEEILRARLRDEFQSYELVQAATYLDSLSNKLRVHRK